MKEKERANKKMPVRYNFRRDLEDIPELNEDEHSLEQSDDASPRDYNLYPQLARVHRPAKYFKPQSSNFHTHQKSNCYTYIAKHKNALNWADKQFKQYHDNIASEPKLIGRHVGRTRQMDNPPVVVTRKMNSSGVLAPKPPPRNKPVNLFSTFGVTSKFGNNLFESACNTDSDLSPDLEIMKKNEINNFNSDIFYDIDEEGEDKSNLSAFSEEAECNAEFSLLDLDTSMEPMNEECFAPNPASKKFPSETSSHSQGAIPNLSSLSSNSQTMTFSPQASTPNLQASTTNSQTSTSDLQAFTTNFQTSSSNLQACTSNSLQFATYSGPSTLNLQTSPLYSEPSTITSQTFTTNTENSLDFKTSAVASTILTSNVKTSQPLSTALSSSCIASTDSRSPNKTLAPCEITDSFEDNDGIKCSLPNSAKCEVYEETRQFSRHADDMVALKNELNHNSSIIDGGPTESQVTDRKENLSFNLKLKNKVNVKTPSIKSKLVHNKKAKQKDDKYIPNIIMNSNSTLKGKQSEKQPEKDQNANILKNSKLYQNNTNTCTVCLPDPTLKDISHEKELTSQSLHTCNVNGQSLDRLQKSATISTSAPYHNALRRSGFRSSSVETFLRNPFRKIMTRTHSLNKLQESESKEEVNNSSKPTTLNRLHALKNLFTLPSIRARSRSFTSLPVTSEENINMTQITSPETCSVESEDILPSKDEDIFPAEVKTQAERLAEEAMFAVEDLLFKPIEEGKKEKIEEVDATSYLSETTSSDGEGYLVKTRKTLLASSTISHQPPRDWTGIVDGYERTEGKITTKTVKKIYVKKPSSITTTETAAANVPS